MTRVATEISAPSLHSENQLSRALLHLLLIVVTLVLLLEGRDSAAPKLPLFFAFALLTASAFISTALRRGVLEIQSSPLDIPVLAFVSCVLLSAAVTWQPGASGAAVSLLISAAICVFAGSTLFTHIAQVERLQHALTVVTLLVATIGIAQYFFGDLLPVRFFLGQDRRPGSTFGNPIFLSTYIVLVFPFLLAQLLTRRGILSALLAPLLLTLLELLIATGTRSSIAGFAVSLVVMILATRHRRRSAILWIAILLFVTGAFALLVFPAFGSRLSSAFSGGVHSSFLRRLHILEGGYRAFLNSPWVGHGVGRFETVLPAYRSPDYWTVGSEDVSPHAHCEPLEVGVELGIGGVVLALVIISRALRSGFHASRSGDTQRALYAAGITAGLIGALTDGLMNVSLRQPPMAALVALFAGLTVSPVLTGVRNPLKTSFRPFRRMAPTPILLCVIVLAPYATNQIEVMKSERYLIRGIVAEAGGDLINGARLYEDAATHNPLNLLAQSNCARLELATGRPRDAAQRIRYIRQYSPAYPKSDLIDAAATLALGDSRGALLAIDREILRRNHPEAFAVKARILHGMADTSGEHQALGQLLDACIRGGIDYRIDEFAGKFGLTARSHSEVEESARILERLIGTFPHSRTPGVVLEDLDRRLHAERR